MVSLNGSGREVDENGACLFLSISMPPDDTVSERWQSIGWRSIMKAKCFELLASIGSSSC